MKNNLKKKIDTIKNINELLSKSISTTIVEYKNVKSIEIKILRKKLLEQNIKIKITKNTLTKRAILDTNNVLLKKYLSGQILIIFSEKEDNLPIKILDSFVKKNENFKIKAICLYGHIFLENDIKNIISMPNKEMSLQNLVHLMRSPLIKLINTLKLINN